ncbi:MAG: YjbQ family protein [Methanosphaera stadtmanae]|jgi:secondary thiamine-phosphate synthase enzyme|nr:YjbQ family protein [Methanosphaera stadtmanae]
MFYHEKIHISTKEKFEIINITDDIKRILEESDIEEGLINISTKHTTSAIIINEDENGLLYDYEELIKSIIPDKSYRHDIIDNNAKSHLMGLLQNSNQTLPIIGTNLSLGVWQSIFFVDFDGPRQNREVIITIIGE